jgi:hypothetical protein
MRTVEDYARWTQLVKSYYFDQITVLPDTDTVREIYRDNPKTVTVMGHGPASSPSYVHIAMFDILLKHGGSDRRPMGVGWKHFYKVPGMKQFVSYVTNVDAPHDFDEFVKLFIKEDFSDLLIYPEGENCMFGNAVDIQPFMSPRFLEIAIRAKVPILLVVHYGTQHAVYPLKVNREQARWVKYFAPKTGAKLESSGLLSFPKFLAGKIPELKFSFQLYHPQLKLKDLPKNKAARREKLNEEAEEVRGLMQDMVDALKPPLPRRGRPKKPRKSSRKRTA